MNPRGDQRADLENPKIVEALDEYLAALEAGYKPERQAFLARHAEIAEALAHCLEGIDALYQSSSGRHRSANGAAAAALKLSAGQKEQIRAIRDEASAKKRRTHHEGTGCQQQSGADLKSALPFPQSRSSIVARIENNVLTKEQRQRWREMRGEPFKGPLLLSRPGRSLP